MSDVYLYLIAQKYTAKLRAPVKVGVGALPRARLDTLQTGSPYELDLFGVLRYPSRDIALQMEDCFHATHKKYRLRGEWFDIEPTKAWFTLRLQYQFALDMFTTLSEQDQEKVIELAGAAL